MSAVTMPTRLRTTQRNRRYAYYRCAGNNAFRFGGNAFARTSKFIETSLTKSFGKMPVICFTLQLCCRKEYERRLESPGTSDGDPH